MSGYRFVAPALLLVLGGCAAGPDYERPELDVPENYIQPVQQGESFANTPWWELFQDEQLQELIRIALEENQDLGIAAARVEEFRAVLGVTRADQYPSVDITASGAQTEGSDNVFPGSVPGFGDDKVENYRLSADVFWELDLFGRLRRSTEAARAQLLATEEAQRSITISLVASVASTYMLLRDLDAQFEIARRTQDTRTDSLSIIQARFDKGTVPRLDGNRGTHRHPDRECPRRFAGPESWRHPPWACTRTTDAAARNPVRPAVRTSAASPRRARLRSRAGSADRTHRRRAGGPLAVLIIDGCARLRER
jgi:multidrug efflux system outer membrane protein